jgi:hypothetical protein
VLKLGKNESMIVTKVIEAASILSSESSIEFFLTTQTVTKRKIKAFLGMLKEC